MSENGTALVLGGPSDMDLLSATASLSTPCKNINNYLKIYDFFCEKMAEH